MADVFVSYKAEDRRRVRPLVDALRAEGFSVWWDEQIGGGAAWRHTIETELGAARCVVVVWSKRSAGPDGGFVQDEAAHARQRHVYLPVTIDKVHLPLGFGETQAFSLAGWHGDKDDPRYATVRDGVRATMEGKSHHHLLPQSLDISGINRRTAVAGAAAGIAALAVGGWAVLRPGKAAASDSIAVLPFANLSGDPRQTYFSDGIAEELRNALARLARLKVVGRISSEAVRNDDARTAARKLRVANVLTGTVRQSPSTMRISAELIDGRTGIDRWSADYDRSPGDAIVIQTDIAQNVATSLAATLGIAAREAISVGGTSIAEAQRLVIEARVTAREGTKEAREHAMDLVDSAIRLDPNYADAYAQKALELNAYANSFAKDAATLAKDRAEAMRFAQRAVRIAPKLANGHAAISRIFASYLEIAGAAKESELSVKLAPGDAEIVGHHVSLLARLGRLGQALQTADRVISLDPLNHLAYEYRVSALYDIRRYQDGLDYAEKVQRDSPELFRAPGLIADCLLELGRAREAYRVYGLMSADSWQQVNGQTLALIRAGDRPAAMKSLAKLQRLFGESTSYQYAGIYAQLGDHDRALSALEHAYAIRDGGLISIKIDPRLDPLRREPRFNAVLKKMNFPAA
jgi:TolB-like protein/tetratricopeptide (TPR) repeat protein